MDPTYLTIPFLRPQLAIPKMCRSYTRTDPDFMVRSLDLSHISLSEAAMSATDPTTDEVVRLPASTKLDRPLPKSESNGPASSNINATYAHSPSSDAFPSLTSSHPLRIIWEALTVLLSIYKTNQSTLNRCFMGMAKNYCAAKPELPPVAAAFGFHSLDLGSVLGISLHAFYVVDIVLNLFSARKNGKWSHFFRYIATWFLIDALNILPWEPIAIRSILKSEPGLLDKIGGFLRACPAIKKRRHLIVRVHGMARSLGYKPLRHVHQFAKFIDVLKRMKMILLVRGLQHVRLMKRTARAVTERIFCVQ